jgi:SET domain-containing protein
VRVVEMLIIGNTKLKGRGIFAKKRFVKGEVIDRYPVVVIPSVEVQFIDQTILGNYYFDWENKTAAIALGLGSLVNHSYHPNSFYVKKFTEEIVEFTALRNIEVGEEITANYNGNPDNLSPIWFDVAEEISSKSMTNNHGVD